MQPEITIKVTKKDIDAAKNRVFDDCPVIRASRRAFSSAGVVFVGYTVMLVDNETYKLPWLATAFIKAWDSGYIVRPFTFKVHL